MNIDDLYRLLRAGHAQLQGIVDTVTEPLIVLDDKLCVQNASRAFYDTFQVDRFETIGRPIYDLGNGQWNIPELRRLLVDVIPRSSAVINFQVDHTFPDIGRRSMLLTARTLFNPDNVSHTMLLSITDATDKLKRDAADQILFGELRHRWKNLLATAQAMARQTSIEGRTAEEYRDDFMGRFGNLVEASEIAFGGGPEGGLKQLVETVVEPYSGLGAVTIIPSDEMLPVPSVLVSLSLVLHELATNAAKHGSLSVPEGRLEVSWTYDSDAHGLRLRWAERGGPAAQTPERKGFGSKLIASVIAYSLEGELEQSFSSDGLTVDLFVPLADNRAATATVPDAAFEKDGKDAMDGIGG